MGFIGAVGAGALIIGMSRTVIRGEVMAADLHAQLESRGITRVACQDRIPIENHGAVFECTIEANDGSTARIEYTMNRAGSLSAKLIDGTGPTRERVPASSDPWAN
jgi:hypothetical protein